MLQRSGLSNPVSRDHLTAPSAKCKAQAGEGGGAEILQAVKARGKHGPNAKTINVSFRPLINDDRTMEPFQAIRPRERK